MEHQMKSTYPSSLVDEMNDQLDQLFSTYDTRLLSSLMLVRAGAALRALHSVGAWKVEDVKVIVDDVLSTIYTPLPKSDHPAIATTGGDRSNLQ
jgi:hypothetical protein